MAAALKSVDLSFDDVLDGPVWDGSGVLFCAVRRSEIHRWDARTGEVALLRAVTVRTRGLAFAPDGRLYGAQSRARRVVWFSRDGGTYYLNAMLDGQRHNDPQDLVVDRAGRIWFSDRYTQDSIAGPVGFPPLGHNSVLRLTERGRPDGDGIGEWTLERMTFDTTWPSGVALSPDERTLYVVDGTGSVADPSVLKAYEFNEPGPLGAAQPLRVIGEGERVGGCCTDVHGVVALAVSNGASGRVELIDPSGAVVASHDVPGQPTNCCFGGDQLRTLFVTTGGGQLLSSGDIGSSSEHEPPRA
jgi:gluconolactonase